MMSHAVLADSQEVTVTFNFVSGHTVVLYIFVFIV
jgi:hypothetical protein